MTIFNFAPIYNIATGETYHFYPVDQNDTNETLSFKRIHESNRVVPLHIHPYQEERFVILKGQVNFQLGNGDLIVAKAGQVVSIPAGIAHAPINSTSMDNSAIVSFTPELKSRYFFESIVGFSREGKTILNGIPLNPFKAVIIGSTYRDEFELASVPPMIRKLTYFMFGNISKKLGYKPWYKHYTSKIN